MVSHDVRVRPLRPGVSISNPAVDGMGTLGFFATRCDAIVLVTCGHVAHGDNPCDPEVLCQPGGGHVVADLVRTETDLDVAIATVRVGLHPRNDALGIGPLRAPRAPRVGLRVIKSGFVTGVTEGRIKSCDGTNVVIAPRHGVGRDYRLSEPGDSGAAWVTIDTREIVAMHVRGNTSGTEYAEAIRVDAIMRALALTWT